ncbi:PhaM family polyhydroxyalkanoate granule multifunctional regulatory protein [Cupriavidus sp. RAF12]|uniref:PhaM family polyhydroxyalkanoate granule multifunctional regulatory protein n=1 Tax=Cupriavidus sp. RAF12 TaxID=3233050 RepID=UPI003F92E8D1
MFGQIPDFTNGFEFLRKLWASGSGMPSGLMPGLSAMTPPMDLDEVDKRIHDLKAVEGWLQLNASLLRTTIQGLEVQRATLVALQTFGNALSPEAMQSAMENVARAANAPSATPPHFHQPAPETISEEEADAANAEEDEDDFDAPPDTGAAEASASASASGDEASSESSAGAAQLPPNASLWWDLLQQQFTQIAAGATAAAASGAPFGNLAGFCATPPGAEGAERAEAGAKAANGATAPKPAAKKSAAKKPAAKKVEASKVAAKKGATKKATAKTATVKKAPAKKTPAKAPSPDPAKTTAPDTPEDLSE